MAKSKKKKKIIQQPEFTTQDLPATRFLQFFDIFKIEWRNLTKLGLLNLIFLIPFFAVYFLMLFFASSAGENPILVISLGYVGLYLTLFIVAVHLSGMGNVLKKMIYGEGVLFKDDYFEGIKKNYGQFAIITAIYGLIYLIIDFSCKYVFGFEGIVPIIFSAICTGFLFLLLTPIVITIVSECTMYEITFKSAIKNSLLLVVSRFWQYLIVGLILLAMNLVFSISNFLILLLVASLILLLICPLIALAILLISTSSFDVLINKDSFPELFKKGLKKEGNNYDDLH